MIIKNFNFVVGDLCVFDNNKTFCIIVKCNLKTVRRLQTYIVMTSDGNLRRASLIEFSFKQRTLDKILESKNRRKKRVQSDSLR